MDTVQVDIECLVSELNVFVDVTGRRVTDALVTVPCPDAMAERQLLLLHPSFLQCPDSGDGTPFKH
jgi:hypothetical protein